MSNSIFVCYTSIAFMTDINRLCPIEGVIFHDYSKILEENKTSRNLELSKTQSKDNILLLVAHVGFFSNFEENFNALQAYYSDITVKRVLYLTDSFSMIARKAQLPAYYLLQRMSLFFGNIYSFSMHDHFAYNFCFHPTISTKLKDVSNNSNSIDYDAFFIGAECRRIDVLIRIATKLKEKGITYKFIVFDPKKAGTQIDEIYFIGAKISYAEIINYVKHSNVLVCIKRPYATDPPLSFYESILYNKKLLTNCDIVNRMPFIKMSNVRFVDDIFNDKFDYNFFKSQADEYNFPDDFFSLSQLIEHIRHDYLYGYLSDYYFLPQNDVIYFHFSGIGWIQGGFNQEIVKDGHQLEAIYLYVKDLDLNVSIYQKKKGWMEQRISNKPIVGITGKALPILAIKFSSLTPNCSLRYKVSLNNVGWLKSAEDEHVTGYKNSCLDDMPNNNFINGIYISLERK